jgi:hypothetical protein
MVDQASGLIAALVFLTLLWFLVGRPGQRSRRAKPDRFFSLPKYDRGDNLPGTLLALQATWVLVQFEWALALPVFGLLGVLGVAGLIAFLAAKSNLMGAGLGLISSTALIADRVQGGGEDCLAYSVTDQVAFYVGAVLIVAVLLGLAVALKPVAMVGKFMTPPIRLPGGGRAKKPSMFAAVSLSTFASLDVLDLATRPGGVDALGEWTSASLAAAVGLVVGLACLAVFITIMPSFTLSILGAGTLFAVIAVDNAMPDGCIDWGTRLWIAGVFIVVNQITAKFFSR